MRNNINISYNDQVFKYLIEYTQGNTFTDSHDIKWQSNGSIDTVYLFENDINVYRKKNDWYKITNNNFNSNYIPENVKLSTIRIYVPMHSVNTYLKNIRYAINITTYINGKKIDLGSMIFKPNDTVANENGPIKDGNNEYNEYVEFDIIDPFSLMYSDDWIDFRHYVCEEPLLLNNAGSLLSVSMYIVEDYNNKYIIKNNCIGGATAFSICDESGVLSLDIKKSLDPLGFVFTININKEYNWLLTYLEETYNLSNISHNNIKFELVIKNKDTIIPGPKILYNAEEEYGKITQNVSWEFIKINEGFKTFFNSWNSFEEGWNIVGSLNIYNEYDEEIITCISNELPITQELFSFFVNDGSRKIISTDDMNVITYNVVNKIENTIVQLDRSFDSKLNMIQPVFFKVKDSEKLTLHPDVTENICINLDDYKSKVEKFTLKIADCMFEQIGANQYGIIFKISANKISSNISNGTYYILNENFELVTTGKYNCVR